MKKIKILEDGPYVVSGSVPLKERVLGTHDGLIAYVSEKQLQASSEYRLCRCGYSKDHPFCDGSHVASNFVGTETSSREPYLKRAGFLEGETVDLLDDHRCALARFCHKKHGSAWDLPKDSSNPVKRDEAILAAADCPAGRLTSLAKNQLAYEYDYGQEIIILQDPEKGCSAGLFVSGYLPVEAADGTEYERRNRITLCRCGKSNNKPFCDAMHMRVKFKDDHNRS